VIQRGLTPKIDAEFCIFSPSVKFLGGMSEMTEWIFRVKPRS